LPVPFVPSNSVTPIVTWPGTKLSVAAQVCEQLTVVVAAAAVMTADFVPAEM
jgi:hypothetical protein